uniref:Uncharacterized protein n=1 Tax=Noccaea caerulescens TaxID=107243 RepID=A0A1J3IGN2_NOCCA
MPSYPLIFQLHLLRSNDHITLLRSSHESSSVLCSQYLVHHYSLVKISSPLTSSLLRLRINESSKNSNGSTEGIDRSNRGVEDDDGGNDD